ncbi:MAG: AAA family ATPase, partial [Anaerolineales bacterium]|nr:AAA family ATPase [Anaerolineales bacterium]
IGQMYGLTRQVGRERGDTLLAVLDLTAKRDKLARTLSGGMQRRLNLAMALVHDPDILVLDEPEAGLDPQSRVKVREYIQSLARLKTIILTTHNMDEADRLADRVAIIDHGRLLVVDTPEALKGQVGEGDMIEIKVENLDALDTTRLEKRISNQVRDAVVDLSQQLLRVRALNAVRVLPVILDILEEGGAQASDVRIRENSLEDVFIQLTGRRLRS